MNVSRASGRRTIELFKELFGIDESLAIRSLVIRAANDDVTTMEITALAKMQDIDIKSNLINKNDIINESKYEITIKRTG